MFHLRPYQNKTIDAVRKMFKSGKKRIIMCAPTGSGKTVMFTKIIVDTFYKDLFNRVLVLTDRIELFSQTYKAIKRAEIEPFILNAKAKQRDLTEYRVVVAMIETLKRRKKTLKTGDFNLIIIDEAHKANFNAIFEMYPDSFIIGATATPISASKKRPLKLFYQDIVEEVTIPELVEDGFLVREHPYAMMQVDPTQLKKDSKTGDYTEASQQEAFGNPKMYEGIIHSYLTHCVGKKTIVFCPNIAVTQHVATLLDAEHVSSLSTPSERNLALQRFHENPAGVMVNCGILTTGYDHPAIECVILFRATTSETLFLQMIGRASRPSPGKQEMIVIDHGTNYERLGRWSENREWIKKFHNPPKKKDGVAPTKTCPKCEAIVSAKDEYCEFCGHKFEVKSKEVASGVLVDLNLLYQLCHNRRLSSLSVKELVEVAKAKKWKQGFILRILRNRGYPALREYARIKGYHHNWPNYAINGPSDYTDFTIKL
jgi:superfamily II DNA or RNA helicase